MLLLPSSVLAWMLFWGLFFYPFLPQIFGIVVFLFISAWKARGLNLFLLLPQELGARNRDEAQGRCPSIGNGIWWPKFRTGPTELPAARQKLLSVGALLVFPDTR